MNKWVKVTNKYPTKCRICRESIPVGEIGYWMKGAGFIHEKCFNNEKKFTPDIGIPLRECPYPDSSRKAEIYRKLNENNMNKDQAYDDLKSEVAAQNEPFVYRRNTGDGSREPKPIYQQTSELYKEIVQVANEISRTPATQKKEQLKFISNSEDAEDSSLFENKIEDDREWYLAEVKKLRKFCVDSNFSGQFVDTISMRPVVEGAKAFNVGIPLKAMANAITLHWSPESRDTSKAPTFDLVKYCKELEKPKGEKHYLMPYVKKLAEARIPILLVGPKGTGKSYVAQQLAREIELEFSYMSLNGAATPSWFFGNWTPDPVNPYKTRPLKELYRNGGVFCLDELDAGEPNMLLVVNNLISSDILNCPMTGEIIPKHKDFIIVATANTFGLGANKEYRGRERLDDATLDRFRMGRVVFTIDEKLERKLLFSD